MIGSKEECEHFCEGSNTFSQTVEPRTLALRQARARIQVEKIFKSACVSNNECFLDQIFEQKGLDVDYFISNGELDLNDYLTKHVNNFEE